MTSLLDLGIELDHILDPQIHQAITLLFNLVEEVSTDNDKLRAELQAARDEIARLKGEQGQPTIRGRGRSDLSSERERGNTGQQPKQRKRGRGCLAITRTETIPIDQSTLPEDAVPKGYSTSRIQDLVISTEVIELRRETWYSPSLGKTFTATLPAGYRGAYGPRVKALVTVLKYVGNMSEPAITGLLKNFGIDISKSSVDRLLLKDQESFHQEKADIFRAGLSTNSYHHIDDTGARVRGENWYSHILCSPLYSAFFTRTHKDRLTLLCILSATDSLEQLPYIWNSEAEIILATMGIANKHDSLLASLPRGHPLTHSQLTALLKPHKLTATAQRRLLEAAAIAAYHARTDITRVHILMADDAPQFKLLSDILALCWIHDGRHYKKLRPVMQQHRQLLDSFLDNYWVFYHQLLAYKDCPQPEQATVLTTRFENLFSTVTGYDQLDDRIGKTKAKQAELLRVLQYPELPLHNNPAELGARVQVRKRDVSLHTMTDEGTKVQDTFLTLVETAKKLGVNSYDYLLDRVSGAYAMPSLADTIRQRSGQPTMAAS